MIQIKKLILITLFPLSLLYSCNGNGNANTSKDGTSSSTKKSSSSSTSDASFSCEIDGVPVSGVAIDEMQLNNTAFHYPASNNALKHLLFILISDKKGDDYYSFRFSVPDGEGVYHPTNGKYNETHSSMYVDFHLRSTKDFSRYNEDAVTVTIDKITATRISGTFSGTLKVSVDTPNAPKKGVTVTDGKFDIPFSTGNIRPE